MFTAIHCRLSLPSILITANGSDLASCDLGLGYYIAGDWTVAINTSFDDDVDYTGVTFSTQTLIDLGGDTFLNIDAAIAFPDEGDDGYAVCADYYFNDINQSYSAKFC